MINGKLFFSLLLLSAPAAAMLSGQDVFGPDIPVAGALPFLPQAATNASDLADEFDDLTLSSNSSLDEFHFPLAARAHPELEEEPVSPHATPPKKEEESDRKEESTKNAESAEATTPSRHPAPHGRQPAVRGWLGSVIPPNLDLQEDTPPHQGAHTPPGHAGVRGTLERRTRLDSDAETFGRRTKQPREEESSDEESPARRKPSRSNAPYSLDNPPSSPPVRPKHPPFSRKTH